MSNTLDESSSGEQGLTYVLFRLVGENPSTARDFLSHAALGLPARKRNPPPQRDWEGLSTFTTYQAVRDLAGGLFRWERGVWIAVLVFPPSAPFTFEGPTRKGHVSIYDAHGNMLLEDGGELIRQKYVAQLVHGPSVEAFTF